MKQWRGGGAGRRKEAVEGKDDGMGGRSLRGRRGIGGFGQEG